MNAGLDLEVAGRVERPAVGFAAICLGYFAIILDGSVLNVAVPAIRADFQGSLAGAQWVLNAYTLTLAGLLLTAGALGDRVGLRRMFLVGVSCVHRRFGGLRCRTVDPRSDRRTRRAGSRRGGTAARDACADPVPVRETGGPDRERRSYGWGLEQAQSRSARWLAAC